MNNSNTIIFPSDLPFPPTPLNSMVESKKALNHELLNATVLYTNLGYLPAVYERFFKLNTAVNASATALRSSALELYQGMEIELDELPSGVSRPLNSAQLAFSDEAQDAVKRLASNSLTLLTQHYDTINLHFERSPTTAAAAVFEREKADKTLDILALEKSKIAREAEYKVVSDAFAVIKTLTPEASAQDILVTATNIAELGATPPQAAIIKLAIDQLQKDISHISEGFRFFELIRQRDIARKKVEDLQREIVTATNERTKIENQVKFISIIHTLDTHRTSYASEYKNPIKTIEQFSIFLNQRLTDKNEHHRQFLKTTRAFIEYIRPLSLPTAWL